VAGDIPERASATRSSSGLALRIVSAAVLVPLAIGTAYVGGWPFAIFWGAAALGIGWEWSTVVGAGRPALAAALAALALAVALAPLHPAAA